MSVDCVIFGCLLSAVAGQGELGFIQIVLSLAVVLFFYFFYFFIYCSHLDLAFINLFILI